MTVKEIFQKVKAVFDAPIIPEPIAAPITPAALASYKLKDGTEISISGETIEIGGMVTIGGAQAPSGDYELEDGRTITVDAAGAITLIVTPEPITTDLSEQPSSTLEDRTKKLEENIAAIEAKIGAPANFSGLATEAQLQAAEQKITKQDEVIKGLFELVEKLVEEPTADPKTLTGNQKERFDKRSAKDRRIEAMAEAMKKIKVLN